MKEMLRDTKKAVLLAGISYVVCVFVNISHTDFHKLVE